MTPPGPLLSVNNHMPNSGTFTNNRFAFWDRVAASAEIRKEYKDQLDRLLAGELTGLHYHELRVSGRLKGTASIYTGYSSRLILVPVPDSKAIMVLDEVLEHQYPAYLEDPALLEQRFQQKMGELGPEDYLSCTDRALEASAPETKSTLVEAPIWAKQKASLNLKRPVLTDEQNASLELPAPFMVFAEAGFGKTFFAAAYLRKLISKINASPQEFEMKTDEPTTPIVFAYVAKAKKLVTSFKEQYKTHPNHKKSKHAKVQIKTLEDLCRDALASDELPNFIGFDRFCSWLAFYQESWKNQEKGKAKEEGRSEDLYVGIFENPELLYKELIHMVALSKEAYLCSGIPATSGYFSLDKRVFLWTLCQNYLLHMEKTKAFDLALNPPLDKLKKGLCHSIIVDESQILSPKEIELLLWLAESKPTAKGKAAYAANNNQILWLYGRHQSMNFCNRHYFSALKLPIVTFNKSFRNPWEVTKMANNLTKIELQFGNSDSPEFQPKEIEPNLTKSGKISWGSPDQIPESMKAGSDHTLRIVTRKEYVEEAKKLFKTKFVFTPEQIQGSDCDNLVLYKMLGNPLFNSISGLLPKTDFEPSGNRAKRKSNVHYEEKTDQKICIGEIQSACETLHVALTRATNEIAFIEEPSGLRRRFVEVLQKGLTLSPLGHEAHASTPEEWLSIIEEEHKKGNISQALEALDSLLEKFPDRFTVENIAAIKEQFKHGKGKAALKTEEAQESKALSSTATESATATRPNQTSEPITEPTSFVSRSSTDSAILKKYANGKKLSSVSAMVSLLNEPYCATLLFTPRKPQMKTLFTSIMEDPKMADRFSAAFMKCSKHLGKIPDEHLGFPLLIACSKNSYGMKFLGYLLEKKAQFSKQITSDQLFSPEDEKEKQTWHLIGNKNLFLLLNKNKALLAGLPEDFLKKIQPISVLSYFVNDREGRLILDLICEQRASLVLALSQKELEEVLVVLVKTTEGRKLLSKMISINPKLNEKMNRAWATLSGCYISKEALLTCKDTVTGYHLQGTDAENEIFELMPSDYKKQMFFLPGCAAKETKFESKEAPKQAAPKKSQEEGQAKALFKQFDARRLKVVLSTYAFEPLFLTTYTDENGQSFALQDRLYSDESCRMVFSSCLVNNLKLLYTVPLEKISFPKLKTEGKDEMSKLVAWHTKFQAKTWLNKLKEVRDFLLLHPPSEKANIDGLPVVHVAVALCCGDKILRDLKSLGADFNFKTTHTNESLVHLAIKLCRELNTNMADLRSSLLLLKELGTDFMMLDVKGYSPMHIAAEFPDPRIIDILIEVEPGLSLSLEAEDGTTPVFLAVMRGNISILRKIKAFDPSFDLNETYIITRGTEIGADEFDEGEFLEHTFLEWAAEYGNVDLLKILRELDPNLPLDYIFHRHLTPASLAAANGHMHFIRALYELENTLLLNKPDNLGYTPVFEAIKSKNFTLLLTLFELNVTLESYRETNRFNLGVSAVNSNDMSIIQLLVDMKYDMNIPIIADKIYNYHLLKDEFCLKEDDLVSPLSLAKMQKQHEIVCYLTKILKGSSQPTECSASIGGVVCFFKTSIGGLASLFKPEAKGDPTPSKP